MSSIREVPKAHDVSAVRAFAVEVRADPAFELLVGLSALTGDRAAERRSWLPGRLDDCSRGLRHAVDRVGPEAGEVWLHLLGLALESPVESAPAFVELVAATDARELR